MHANNPETIYFAGSGDWTQARLITVSGCSTHCANEPQRQTKLWWCPVKILTNDDTNPSMKPQTHGKPRIKWDAMAAVTASTRHGVKAKRITPNDSLRRATGSKPRPARVRITVSAIALHRNTQKQQHQDSTTLLQYLQDYRVAQNMYTLHHVLRCMMQV